MTRDDYQVARDMLLARGHEEITFGILFGETIVEVKGLEHGSEEVVITCASGLVFAMRHFQDCCEHVYVEDVIGDINDLIGHGLEVMMAEAESNKTDEPPPGRYCDSYTWTFYKLATVRGYVTIRWLGESNGYYGEEVDFLLVGLADTSS